MTHHALPTHRAHGAHRADLAGRRAAWSRLAALAAATLGLTGPAAADTWPSKPITLIVPAAAGGTTDLAARMLAEPLGKALGQTVVVDNRAGASGAIAAAAVKQAAADGHTLLMQYSGYHVITPHLTKKPQWEPADFQPVAGVLAAPQLVVLRAGLPVKSMAELVAYAKKNPGKLTYASSGKGSLQHATGAMLEQLAGIDMTHVPYKGTGPALQDLLGGQVDLTFGTPPPFVQSIQGGKLQAVAVTGRERLATLPAVPTTQEAGYGKLDATSWFAVFASTKVPPAVVQRLSSEIQKIVATPAFQQKAADLGASGDYRTPAQLGELVKADFARWGEVVKSGRIEAE